MKKKKIVVIDLSVKKTSPGGSCVLSELVGLEKDYEITVISNTLESNVLNEVGFKRIPLPKYPNLLRYIAFYFYVKALMFRKSKYGAQLIQSTQGQYSSSDIVYAHFCHKAYLAKHWKNVATKGLRGVVRNINHHFNAWTEAKAFKNAKAIVVPSVGLAKEIIQFYPNVSEKIKPIPNPINVQEFAREEEVRCIVRKELGYKENDVVIAFSALGDFKRKGLDLLCQSAALLYEEGMAYNILVIGGNASEISSYKSKAIELGIENLVKFTGFKTDVRPYFWASDIFALPSAYETFSLVSAQAAAAGLPLLVTAIYGVEDYLKDNENGWLIDRSVASITQKLRSIFEHKEKFADMGKKARFSVQHCDQNVFRENWKKIYATLLN